jgi:hypothetical protein
MGDDIIIQKSALETVPDFDSLASISEWSKAWWTIAWEMLDESEGLDVDSFDDVWALVVRITLRGKMPPTSVSEVICEVLDWGWRSQFVQPL